MFPFFNNVWNQKEIASQKHSLVIIIIWMDLGGKEEEGVCILFSLITSVHFSMMHKFVNLTK